VGVFEEVGVNLVGDAVVDFRHRPQWLGWAGCLRRGAGWRVLPEAAVFEDLVDDLALPSLDVEDPTVAGRR